jgi:hypothetical protein
LQLARALVFSHRVSHAESQVKVEGNVQDVAACVPPFATTPPLLPPLPLLLPLLPLLLPLEPPLPPGLSFTQRSLWQESPSLQVPFE